MDNFKVNVLRPLARRLGSVAAGGVVAFYGIDNAETIQAIEAAGLAVSLVVLDLINSYLERR